MSVFEAVTPQIGQQTYGYGASMPGQPWQGYYPTPGGGQGPFGQQMFGAFGQPSPFAQAGYAPSPMTGFGQSTWPAQATQPYPAQQPFAQMPGQAPFGQNYPGQPGFAGPMPFGQAFPSGGLGQQIGQAGAAGLAPLAADAAARCAPQVVGAVLEALRSEPQALIGIQSTGQLPPQLYPMVLMETANRIAPVLHAVLIQSGAGLGQQSPVWPQAQQAFPMAFAGR